MTNKIFFNFIPEVSFTQQLGLTMLFNTAIALVLSYLVFDGPFLNNLITSQIIGLMIFFTIHAGYILRFHLYKKDRMTLWTTIVFLLTGSAVGVFLLFATGSFLANVSMSKALAENYTTLLQSLFLAILFGGIIIYFFKSKERIIKAESALQKQQISNLDYERRLLETNLRRMQAQIEPHFLFNTLSNVLGLIDTNPGQGKSMLQSFTHYLRTTLDYTRSDSATLGDEIKIVSSYLEIFQVRMGKRLNYTIDIPQELLTMAFPPMLLQPLVENSIKHGLEPQLQGGNIVIRAEKFAERVKIIVEDTGQGLKCDSGTGVGITNVQKRLHALFAHRARFILEDNNPQGLRVVIEVPYDYS